MLELKRTLPAEPVRNPCLGYSFMIISVLGITAVHLFSKIAFTRKPTLTNVDGTFFMGFWLAFIYFIVAQIFGVKLALNNMPRKPLLALFASLIATTLTNLFMFKGISMISVGKSTLVFSMNPLFSMILAYLLLKETITKTVLCSTLGAFVGIYLLSINKDNSGNDSNVIVGIILVMLAAWFQAVIFV